MLELLASNWTTIAPLAAGVLVLLFSERERLAGWLGKLRPAATQRITGLAPGERFDRFYALRVWCEDTGHAEAVKALDGRVLPAIVHSGREGGESK